MNSTNVENACRVCSSTGLIGIFESPGSLSFTSAQVPLPLKIRVAYCRSCGHAQTPPLSDIDSYYDTSYNFRNRDPEEDDIYSVSGDQIAYRSTHQTEVVERKIDLTHDLRVLDYGCGKAASLRQLVDRHPNVLPFAFDVSEDYIASWNEFIPAENQSSYRIPDSWCGQIDVVLAFFALEHVKDPRDFIRTLRQVLRPDGRVHLVVPNLYRNASDLLVADHVNHFSPSSLHRLLHDAGFGNIEIDAESHRAAFVVNASGISELSPSPSTQTHQIAEAESHLRAIADGWSASALKILSFEKNAPKRKAAIYGSGVYGLFIASTLTSLDNLAYFLDMSPYRQGLTLFDRPVIDPREIEDDVEAVLVGLNPRDARQIIEQTPSLHTVRREFVYL